MVGIIICGITGGILLNSLDPAETGSQVSAEVLSSPLATLQTPLNRLFIIVPLVVIGLTLLATLGIEKKYSRYASRSSLVEREDQVTLGRALKVLTASRQTGLFFTFLLVMTISLFMQEGVLEPYGADVFGMPIGETTRLNSYWGLGTLIGV
ncbi:MAG: PucC family protein, partial [Coleofasciculus sp. C2-GNP5-27]